MFQIVEISERPVYLSIRRGFLVIREDGAEKAELPIDDIACLILSGQQSSLSTAVLAGCAERLIPVIVCNGKYHPSAILLSCMGHYRQVGILRLQMGASQPFKKRIWQSLIQGKIRLQAYVLHKHTGDAGPLPAMIDRVLSGDTDNREGAAARHYWQKLFGKSFRRHADDVFNAALNYGYAVLRARVARSLVACGLTPELGIHHDNAENPFCLADDILEVYRPFVDDMVFTMLKDSVDEKLTSDMRRTLASILTLDVEINGEKSPVLNAILRTCQSYARALETSGVEIAIPGFTQD